MGQLTVRNVDERLIRALKERAASHGRSAEAEHRDILRHALIAKAKTERSVTERAAALRQRLRSTIDTTDVIRADRDRDPEP
ncbi:MAG TPA: plasmid stabilization protein [Rhizomicrobium sp.]|nr:plasmid stabilization protein [Rhizomicrobium sp.]